MSCAIVRSRAPRGTGCFDCESSHRPDADPKRARRQPRRDRPPSLRTARSMGMRCIAVFVDAEPTPRLFRRPTRPSDCPVPISTPRPSSPLPNGRAPRPSILVTASCRRTPPLPEPSPRQASAGSARRPTSSNRWATRSRQARRRRGRRPTLPSSEDPSADAQVGYPLLVKASAAVAARACASSNRPTISPTRAVRPARGAQRFR